MKNLNLDKTVHRFYDVNNTVVYSNASRSEVKRRYCITEKDDAPKEEASSKKGKRNNQNGQI